MALLTPIVANTVVGLSLAGGVLVLSLAAIYFRGYLVPGTPTLTKRYFPDWLLAKFDKLDEPEEFGEPVEKMQAAPEGESPDEIEPESWLLEQEVLVPCADVDDLCFPEDVRTDLYAAVEQLRDSDQQEAVATFLELEPEEIRFKDSSRIIVYAGDRIVARWRSEGPMLIDLAAAETLGERVDDWSSLTLRQRSKIASALRPFVDECPLCAEPVGIEEETISSCCRAKKRYDVACEGCGETLLQISRNIHSI
ncbi:hypothetical protein OB905_07455 [Halobacteria archaeon AArc-dxtr1]|nr:hypothetical protein [Halobacteria archaeon AArc-dxtr1]